MENKVTMPLISTLVAEIRIVKIGNKQMTISVFNQLYEEYCFDLEWNILYPIWGKVKRDYSIEYVIFQKGSDLRKMELPNLFDMNGMNNSNRIMNNGLAKILRHKNTISVDKFNKMIEELKNSTQLFIAV